MPRTSLCVPAARQVKQRLVVDAVFSDGSAMASPASQHHGLLLKGLSSKDSGQSFPVLVTEAVISQEPMLAV